MSPAPLLPTANLGTSMCLYLRHFRLTVTSIFLLAASVSLESSTTSQLTIYATSAFNEHSLVASVLVVQQIVNGESHIE